MPDFTWWQKGLIVLGFLVWCVAALYALLNESVIVGVIVVLMFAVVMAG